MLEEEEEAGEVAVESSKMQGGPSPAKVDWDVGDFVFVVLCSGMDVNASLNKKF